MKIKISDLTWDKFIYPRGNKSQKINRNNIIIKLLLLSSERLTGNQVQNMQNKRILGTIGRTLLIAKKII